jgi:hypothetical protein
MATRLVGFNHVGPTTVAMGVIERVFQDECLHVP